MKVKSESEVTQSCPTLSDPMDCSLPGSSICGILQARVLEWGAIAFSLLPVYCKATPGISLYVNRFSIMPPKDLKAMRSRMFKVYPCNASNVSVTRTFPLPFSLLFGDKENDFYFLKSSPSIIQFFQGKKSCPSLANPFSRVFNTFLVCPEPVPLSNS